MAKISVLARKNKKLNQTGALEKAFDIANIVFMILLSFATLYPFWYVIVLSLNLSSDASRGPIWFWPREFTLENYIYVLKNPAIIQAFGVTIARSLIGSALSVVINLAAAYAISKRYLPGRKIILFFFLLPMFVGGSVITNYLIFAKVGLLNNFLVYVIPGAFSFFSMIIIRTFIEGLPDGLEEAAMIDGAGYVKLFLKIVFPLCTPILAAMFFFGIVGGWLDFGTNLLYVTNKSLYVLQYVLYLAIHSQDQDMFAQMMRSSGRVLEYNKKPPTPEVLKMSTLVVVTLPLLFVYPFFQRFFVKGMMVGAIKA